MVEQKLKGSTPLTKDEFDFIVGFQSSYTPDEYDTHLALMNSTKGELDRAIVMTLDGRYFAIDYIEGKSETEEPFEVEPYEEQVTYTITKYRVKRARK